MKYLIVGLGNIGSEYAHTRHNIGFDIVDAFAAKHQTTFAPDRYADMAQVKLKGKSVTLIKPTTYMNLSGKAVRYWLQELKIDAGNMMVLVDDLALPFGTLRMRGNGSDAGHNGLKSINELLLSQNYPRLRFGIGNDFPKGRQIEYVLGKWDEKESRDLTPLISKSVEAIECFILQDLAKAMNIFNTK